MTIDIGVLVVSEATPSGHISSEPGIADWLWFKPSTNRWHKVNSSTGAWEEVDVPTHLHPTLEDINFLGDISVGGDEGITGEFQGTFKKITIKKGIITDFELE